MRSTSWLSAVFLLWHTVQASKTVSASWGHSVSENVNFLCEFVNNSMCQPNLDNRRGSSNGII